MDGVYGNMEEVEKELFPALYRKRKEAEKNGCCPCCFRPLPKPLYEEKED